MNKPTETQAEPTPDSRFLSLMQVHREGEALNDMSAALRELTEAAQLTGKPATVTLKLTIKPAAQIKGAVIIEDNISLKLPRIKNNNSIFYADGEGNLQREDPKQMKLTLRVIESPATVQPEALRKAGAL